LQPDKGLIALRIFDCNGKTAPGVTLSTAEDTAIPWYFVGGFPSGMQTETGPEGLAGFVNVSPGLTIFEASNKDATLLGGVQSVVVRAGWMSSMYVRPPGVQPSPR
jgi:hypothetical protein